MDSVAFQVPSTETLLILCSFLVALFVFAWPLDRTISCGLLAQILVGTIWGTPLTSWLQLDMQNTIRQVGYLGLILVVYEGKIKAG